VQTRPTQVPDGRLGELALVYSTLARSRDAVVFTDVSCTLLGASPRWRGIYGYQIDEILGGNPRLINSRLHPRSFFQELWQDLTRADLGTWSGELVNRKRNGELVSVWQTITAFHGPDEPIVGYLGIARDLTSYREIQDRLLRGTQDLERQGRLKDEQLTTVVHDIKAPLQGIIGHLELAIEGLGTARQAWMTTHLESARGAARRLDTLVRSLLDLRQSESGRLRLEIGRISVRTLLRASVELQAAWAARKNVTFELREEGRSRPAFADGMRIEEAIANVLPSCAIARGRTNPRRIVGRRRRFPPNPGR
jgi:PAS domain S-box-containing protein